MIFPVMIFWSVFDFLLLTVTLLPILRWEHYLVRGWDFPRLQIGCLALASVALRIGFSSEWTALAIWSAAAASLAVIIQTYWIVPYTGLANREVADSDSIDRQRSLRIVASNVLQTNREVGRFLKVIRAANPDVVVVLEADAWWLDQLNGLEAEGYRFTEQCPQDNLYGMLLYSRLELAEVRTEFLVEKDVPSIHCSVRLPVGEWVTTHWLHPRPPSPTENPESGERDAELLIVGQQIADRAARPTIVAGDLNDVAWSPTTRLFRKISGLLDPRVGRGLFSSYHAKIPGLRWPLDHVFHGAEFTLNEIKRLPDVGSDHFPLLMDLQLETRPQVSEGGLSADAEDEAWAEEKMAAKGVQPSDVP